jgi:hypothetical protein
MAFANATTSVATRRGCSHHHAGYMCYGNMSSDDNRKNPRTNATAVTGQVPSHGQRYASNLPKVVARIPKRFSIAVLFLSVLLLLSLASWWIMISLALPQLSSSSRLGRLVRGSDRPMYRHRPDMAKLKQCVLPPKPLSPHQVQLQLQLDSQSKSQRSAPTGIIATLLLFSSELENKNSSSTSFTIGDQQLVASLCGLFPSQLTHFAIPQQLDVLLVVAGGADNHQNYVSVIRKCLNLLPTTPKEDPSRQHEWQNLDGTTLTTVAYQVVTVLKGIPHTTKVYFATQPNLPFPTSYTPHQERTIEPPMCRASLAYVHGTRWYIDELLHLEILQNYDYFIKLDSDVVFLKPIPFHILHDMKVRGAVVGHTGVYPSRLTSPCADGILPALQTFLERRQPAVQEQSAGNAFSTSLDDEELLMMLQDFFCADPAAVEALFQQHFSDRYYTNLFIGRIDFFTHPIIRALGHFLSSEYSPNGFFTHRWTDQMFWHLAYHLLLQETVNNTTSTAIVDYTEFRCAPSSTCWMSGLEAKSSEVSQQSICANNGAFLHTKNAEQWSSRWNRYSVTLPQNIPRYTLPYATRYKEDCTGSRWEVKKLPSTE